jgi:RHS repeat-associated protein
VAANNPPAVAEASTPSDTAFLQAVYMLLLMKDKSAEGAYYYIDNHLGAPQVITDDSGAVVWKAEYLPFGKVNISVAQVENNLRFPGQYYDAETGLHYNWNRFYDPETGRYISADPIGLDGGMNLFAYVGGNPIGKIDYKGLTPLYPGQGVPLDMSVSVPVQVKCCEGYRPYFNSKCENECGDEVENTYPERAYIICLDFIKKYKSSSRVRGVAHCLISEEAKCQGEKKCALRNKCRFNAHIKCYSKYAFLEPFNPFGPGFPDGGPELGWEELFPDWWNN